MESTSGPHPGSGPSMFQLLSLSSCPRKEKETGEATGEKKGKKKHKKETSCLGVIQHLVPVVRPERDLAVGPTLLI